jgi:hypothetical protein
VSDVGAVVTGSVCDDCRVIACIFLKRLLIILLVEVGVVGLLVTASPDLLREVLGESRLV